jgi:flagellar hook assembly protein FlgD
VIAFELAAAAPVRLNIFDLRGHLVRTLANDQREAGSYRIRWDGRDNQGQDAPAGIYLCRLQAGDAAAVQRMALIR